MIFRKSNKNYNHNNDKQSKTRNIHEKQGNGAVNITDRNLFGGRSRFLALKRCSWGGQFNFTINVSKDNICAVKINKNLNEANINSSYQELDPIAMNAEKRTRF